MDLQPVDLHEDVSIEHKYFKMPVPSASYANILVVQFSGQSGFGCNNNSDATYMAAMIRAGIVVVKPIAVLLDLRDLTYEWGDMMAEPFCAGHNHYVRGDLLLVAVVSDLNRKGLTSLLTDEMATDPKNVLFESLEDAVDFIDTDISNTLEDLDLDIL